MTLYQRRKAASECTRCGDPATVQSQYCDRHLDEQREHNRRCAAFLRELRRDNGLCVECGKPSLHAYRCTRCAHRRKLRDAGVAATHPIDP